MKIVIDIPNFEWLKNEEDFKTAVKEYDQGTRFDKEIRNALLNGTPLPEHHGRLIDVNDLLDDINLEDNDYNRDVNTGEIITLENIDRIPTIIEGSDSE